MEAAKIQPTTEKEQKSLEALKNQLKEVIQAIACRQKRIKVADRSEYGWAVVKAYDSDESASDSEDEKRLFKAKKMTEREMSKKRRSTRGKDNQFTHQQTVYQAVGGFNTGGRLCLQVAEVFRESRAVALVIKQ